MGPRRYFSLQELIDAFSIERIHSAGARFDYEKAKWFNHESIKKSTVDRLLPEFEQRLFSQPATAEERKKLYQVIELVKDRCTLLTEIKEQAGFFFTDPLQVDTTAITGKWSAERRAFFEWLADQYQHAPLGMPLRKSSYLKKKPLCYN
jgi:glutamyl-tRNA synthetase